MNRTQLTNALDRMDRLYPNVLRPDYRDEVLGLGASFPPLVRTAKKLSDLLHRLRGVKLDALTDAQVEDIRHLHDALRVGGQKLLAARDWPYDS
ncbi:hypothetical protein GE253_01445 [Niveispirillum sp. SYP-B3756]|uniref:hypothetical protein n=1 Tax=Niveispirillum sp. SYP-B3756 TaxID=2662178 RepID=UPI0012918E10|nr:hypothetical protein [Niveispirillum sp. SYP-B3756]MQP64002.1 hypothetical protein [Niveispirillum sp. SYP-B3756]